MLVAQAIVFVLAAYSGIGLLFALAFVWRGIGIVDQTARSARWTVRVLLIPGSVALWPLLAARWRASSAKIGSRG